MRRIITTIIAAGLLLAGCSSGDDGAGADPRSSPAPVASAATDLASVASQAGCTDWQPSAQSDLELFVAEGGHCTLPSGATVTVMRFVDEAARTSYWDAAKSFGGDRAMTAEVGLVTLNTDEASDMALIRATLAGSPAPTPSEAAPSETPTEDPDAFIAAWEAETGTMVDSDTAEQLTDLGRDVCVRLDGGYTPDELADVMSDNLGEDEAAALVAAADEYLCP